MDGAVVTGVGDSPPAAPAPLRSGYREYGGEKAPETGSAGAGAGTGSSASPGRGVVSLSSGRTTAHIVPFFPFSLSPPLISSCELQPSTFLQ